MAIKLRPGTKKNGYTIVRHINSGAFAIAYEAKNEATQRVFLKEYKSPTVLVNWFTGYVDYQNELKRRIQEHPAASRISIDFVEFFTERHFFYQVFEYVDTGMSLQQWLDSVNDGTRTPSAKERLTFAKVMMAGIKILHDIGVVHTDLKPENIYLIKDPSIALGYRLKIIDLDWSLIADRRAPWHGKQGYIGTNLFQSPEHIRGDIPSAASDVFTSGIMLAQILGKGHPFDGHPEYAEAILSGGQHWGTEISESMESPQRELLEGIIDACLNQNLAQRPTAAGLHAALKGDPIEYIRNASVRGKRPERPAPATPKLTPSESPQAPPMTPAREPARPNVRLELEGKVIMEIRIDTVFGKYHLKAHSEDARFMNEEQFKIYRDEGQQWMLAAMLGTANQTLVNGALINGPVPVMDGMRVAVGNAAKGVEKIPLTLRIVTT